MSFVSLHFIQTLYLYHTIM